MTTTEQGHGTGTKDRLYNLVWFTEQSLSNALRLETYILQALDPSRQCRPVADQRHGIRRVHLPCHLCPKCAQP